MDGEALADVIRGAQRGEPAAFDQLVDLYAGRLFGFLYRLTGSRHDAEDLMQEVFVRIVRMIGAYSHDGRFEAWIFRIAANLVRDRVRRAVRAPKLSRPAGASGEDSAAADPFEELPSGLASPEERLTVAEDVDRLGAAMARLPEAERQVILLRHCSQLSFKEIAELMGTPLGTALARGHRGLLRLRALMTDEGGGQLAPAGPRVATKVG